MLKRLWKSNFIARHLSLTHEDPRVFIKSQWQQTASPSIYYLCVRVCFVVFFLSTWLISVIDQEDGESATASYRAKWMIYLTNWGYTICTLQALLSVAMLVGVLLTSKNNNEEQNHENKLLAKTYKVYWVVNVVATDVAFGITVVFWSVIYEGGEESPEAMNLIVHGFNSIAMFLDLWIVAHPVRLLHCGWSILFGLCYVIFSAIYYLAGGTAKTGATAIYTILDWDSPGTTTLICLGVMVFLIVLHIFSYGVFRLREYLQKKLYPKKTESAPADTQMDSKNTMEIKGYINEGMAQETA